jgi:hypothetical protein
MHKSLPSVIAFLSLSILPLGLSCSSSVQTRSVTSIREVELVADRIEAAEVSKSNSGAEIMQLILRSQQAYHLENNTFASNIQQLDPQFDTRNYRLSIVSANTQQSIAKAIPKLKGLRSYAGGALQQRDLYSQIVCESDQPAKTIASPILSKGVWRCGQGSHVLIQPGLGKSAVGTLLRAQQAYRLENNTFATKISQLDVRLDPMFYRYGIARADDNHTVVTVVPKTVSLKGYTGGLLQRGDTAIPVICEGAQSDQSVALPYLKNGAWVCGKGSYAVK